VRFLKKEERLLFSPAHTEEGEERFVFGGGRPCDA